MPICTAGIEATRWPDRLEDVEWEHGTEPRYLRKLTDYWRDGFDWRRYEARINAHPQFMARFNGLATHLIHARSPHADATPLLLMHGWPGSIVELLEVVPRLTRPERFGGRAEDACHVVCPSLPGYGFSEAPRRRGMGPRQVAERHLALMHHLGYERFVAQGGDWGAIIARFLPELAGDRLLGLHLNLLPSDPPPGLADAEMLCTAEERATLEREKAATFDKLGYAHIQGTRPQTLAYGLTDSPVGLCAWITEKFRDWSDNGGDLRGSDKLGTICSPTSRSTGSPTASHRPCGCTARHMTVSRAASSRYLRSPGLSAPRSTPPRSSGPRKPGSSTIIRN